MSESSDSRSRLLRTASRLFLLQGYHATGLNQILQESQAPKGSLYYYFPGGKEELAAEAIQVTAQAIMDRWADYMQGRSPIETVTIMLEAMADDLDRCDHSHGGEGVPIALLALETWHMSERLRKACEAAFDQWHAAFSDQLIAYGWNPDQARRKAIMLHSLLEGVSVLCRTKKNSGPLRAIIPQIPLLLQPLDMSEQG